MGICSASMAFAPPVVPAELAEALAECGPNDDLQRDIVDVEKSLRAKGLDDEAQRLHEVSEQVSLLGGMGRAIGGFAGTLRDAATRQWELVNRELSESREVMSLLVKRLNGEIGSFSAAEEDLVRAQVADLFRMVPATALALAPVPGMAVVTPFVLRRLNLLPSAWRESNAVYRLEQTAGALHAKGETEEAEKVEAMIAQLRDHHLDREDRIRTLRQHPSIRLMYDFNMDGVIDDEEWAVIKGDRDQLRALVEADVDWYFTVSGEVEGPLSVASLRELPLPEQALVCADGLERWVPVEMLCDVLETSTS